MRRLPILFLTLAALLFASCQTDPAEAPAPEPAETAPAAMTTEASTLYAALQQTEILSELERAVDLAELGPILSDSSASFTVFAPTDEAFERIDQVTLNSLFEPENREALRNLLLVHVVEGRLPADSLMNRTSIVTANQASFVVGTVDGTVRVGEAQVVQPNAVTAGNGIVHVIDQVLMPQGRETLSSN